MTDCTCESHGICVACRHTWIPEPLALGHKRLPPFRSCHPSKGRWNGRFLEAVCGDCISTTTYRWRCSSCSYKTAWIEDGWALTAEQQAFASHHPTAWRIA